MLERLVTGGAFEICPRFTIITIFITIIITNGLPLLVFFI